MSRKALAASPALILAAGFFVLFIAGGGRFAIGLTLRPIVDELHWDRADIGLAAALFQIVSAVAMFVFGRLADRSSPRLVLGGGLLISGIGMGLMSVMNAPWHALLLYGGIYALGNGAASLTVVGVMVTRAFPTRTGIANALVMSGMSTGQLVMMGGLATLLVTAGWRPVYVWLGAAHLILLPLLLLSMPKATPAQARAEQPRAGMGVMAAARTRQFWLLLAVYAICGLDDFFVTTHVAAFALDRGVDALLAGNLLAIMGLTGLLGVIAAGWMADRAGPVWPTALAFGARIAVFGLILVDQSTISVTVFALVFGLSFLVTAPLTVVFVSESFGMRHLGALTGIVTMVHHIFGGLGAYLGAALFDRAKSYDSAFVVMLVSSVLALVLTLMLARPREAAV